MNKVGWRKQKPPVGTPIDYSHYLSKGLVGCWVINETGGALFDCLSGIKATHSSTGVSRGFTELGQSIITSGAANVKINLGCPPAMNNLFTETNSEAGCIFTVFIPPSDGNRWMSKFSTAGTFKGWELNYQSANARFEHVLWMTGNSSTSNYCNIGDLPNDGLLHSVLINATGNFRRYWIDGKSITPATNNNSSSYTDDTGVNACLGNMDNLDRPSDGTWVVFYAWRNRKFTDADAKLLHENPYCFFKTPRRRMIFSSGGGGSSFQPAWARNANSLIYQGAN